MSMTDDQQADVPAGHVSLDMGRVAQRASQAAGQLLGNTLLDLATQAEIVQAQGDRIRSLEERLAGQSAEVEQLRQSNAELQAWLAEFEAAQGGEAP